MGKLYLLLLDRSYIESPVCKINVAVFSNSSLLQYSLMCNWTAVGHTFVLAAVQKQASPQYYVRPSGLQDRSCRSVMVPASVILLNIWALRWLWPVRSFMTTTCCQRSRKWKSSIPNAVLSPPE